LEKMISIRRIQHVAAYTTSRGMMLRAPPSRNAIAVVRAIALLTVMRASGEKLAQSGEIAAPRHGVDVLLPCPLSTDQEYSLIVSAQPV
jgi:hypothetical protein